MTHRLRTLVAFPDDLSSAPRLCGSHPPISLAPRDPMVPLVSLLSASYTPVEFGKPPECKFSLSCSLPLLSDVRKAPRAPC